MIAALVIVCAVLFALFLVAAVAGNRAQTRMVAEQAEAERRRAGSVHLANNGDLEP